MLPKATARTVSLGANALAIEAQALLALEARLRGPMADAFANAIDRLLACRGRVVVMGMGKSGHVGRKIAATLASTGTPALFVHPAEASHGDLGMVTPADVVIALSNSGESDELNAILPVLKRLGASLIAITGRADSTLALHADVALDSSVAQEACPLNLAPTASTTAQLALGDALAVALLDARGFREEDFARSHPGGALGRKLLTHVSDVMRSGDAVPPRTTAPRPSAEICSTGNALAASPDAVIARPRFKARFLCCTGQAWLPGWGSAWNRPWRYRAPTYTS